MIPKTIVVPLDGSAFAERALSVAAILATRLQAGLLLMTTGWDAVPERSRANLERMAEGFPNLLTEVRVTKNLGPADAIASVTAERPDRVVCMTTHGRGRLRWAMMGSVAEEVVHRSTTPVVLVGRRSWSEWPEPASKLVSCVDGSTASEASLAAAIEWSRALELGLIVAEVVHPSDLEGVARREVILDPLIERLEADQATAEPVVLRSSYPAGELLDYAEELPAAMLAMSTHGRTGYPRITLGSVTMGVLNSAPCPVLVTRARLAEPA